MIGFVGSHFLVIVVGAFGLFSAVLGVTSVADAFTREA